MHHNGPGIVAVKPDANDSAFFLVLFLWMGAKEKVHPKKVIEEIAKGYGSGCCNALKRKPFMRSRPGIGQLKRCHYELPLS